MCMLSKLPNTGYPSPGKTKHFCTLLLGMGVIQENTVPSMIYLQKEESKISFYNRYQSSMAWGIYPCSPHKTMYLCTPLSFCSRKTLTPPQMRGYNSEVGQVPYDAHASSKDKEHSLSLKPGKILLHNVICSAQAV